jgi:glucokinase
VSLPVDGQACAIGVDVGGTKIAAAVVRRDGTVGNLLRIPTPSGDAVPDAIAGLVESLLEQHDVQAIGVSIAGFVRCDSRTVVFTPNIDEWQSGDLAGRLQARLHRPVVVENDGNCAAWGEAVHGAGAGHTSMVCLTVGTGLGGGIVADGRLVRGSSGFAGEFGHMVLVPDGPTCTCGGSGCWEQYVSGSALLRAYEEFSARLPSGETPATTGKEVTTAALAGESAALRSFAAVGGWLGRGLAGLTAALDPEMFVIGGGVAEAGPLLLDPARRAYAAAVTPKLPFRSPVRIAEARLGGLAGVVGVADLALLSKEG